MEQLTEDNILSLLQGHWLPVHDVPAFRIIKRKVIIDGDVIGIGIPGFDNNTSTPLLLKWNTDVMKWQLFIQSLGWLCTFIDEIAGDHFIVSNYDTVQNVFEEPLRVDRFTGELQ